MNKTILNVLTFCKVCLQYVINYHRVVTQQVLLMRTIKDEMGTCTEWVFVNFKVHRVDSHCLLLGWDRAWKIRIFLWLYKLTPVWFEEDFLGDMYDFYIQKMWNVAVDDMPIKWHKRNWYKTCGLSEKWKVLLYAFLFFFVGYISKCSSWPVVSKSKLCHLGKPGLTPVFKMASKTAASRWHLEY